MRPQDLVRLDMLVGLTYYDTSGEVIRQEQFHGPIEEADESTTWIRPDEDGGRRWVPTDLRAFRPAPGGTYRLASTGKCVTDPILLTSWMLTESHDEHGQMSYEVEPNHAPLAQSRVPSEWDLAHVIKPDHIRRAIELFGDEYVGRTLLLGVTYTGPGGEFRSQVQLVGTVMLVDFDRGIVISCEPDGETFVLPGDPCWVERASRGEYRLRSTGRVVINPDYIAKATIGQPD